MTKTSRATTVSISVSSENTAHELEAALSSFDAPVPLAVSAFESHERLIGSNPTWNVDVYFDEVPNVESLRTHFNGIESANQFDLRISPTPDENWVSISQSALPPVHAGAFTIHGSHDRHKIAAGPNAIEIEAGEAFGTAHHATTYLCLEAIGRLTQQTNFQCALDLGCGSGILAIALARSDPRCKIIASDIDPKAIEVTIENAHHNRVGSRIKAICADGVTHPQLTRPRHFDLIIANILAQPLISLSRHIGSIANPKATIILSGLLTSQAASVLAAYRASGFSMQKHMRREEWSALILQKT